MFAIRRDVLLNRFSHRGAKFSIITGSIYKIDPVLRGWQKYHGSEHMTSDMSGFTRSSKICENVYKTA